MSLRRSLLLVAATLGCMMAAVACSGDDAGPAPTTSTEPTSVTVAATGTTAAITDPAPAGTVADTTTPSTTTPPAPTRSHHLVGDARPSLAEGPPGELSAAPAGPPQLVRGFDGITNVQFPLVPFVVRNRTPDDVAGYRLDVVAHDPATGAQYVATVGATTPNHLGPGEWGLATVEFFDVEELPEGVTFDIRIGTAESLPDEYAEVATHWVDLDISGLRPGKKPRTGKAFVLNAGDEVVSIPFTFVRYCVSGDEITSTEFQLPGDELHEHSFVPDDAATVVFTRPADCPSILVGAVSFVR